MPSVFEMKFSVFRFHYLGKPFAAQAGPLLLKTEHGKLNTLFPSSGATPSAMIHKAQQRIFRSNS
jgi:hypothetical protein